MTGLKPLNDLVLVERIDETDGKERVSAGGIILPAKDMTLKHGRAAQIPDTYRARVLAVSAKAEEVGLAEGDEVIVHTYDQRPDQTLAGQETPHGLFVRIDDVLCVLEPDNVTDLMSVLKGPAAREYFGAARADRIADELAKMPLLGMIPKTKEGP